VSLTLVPELIVSLCLQCTVVLLITRWLALRARFSTEADSIWGHGHLATLVICVAGVAMPHVRLLQHDQSLQILNTIAQSGLFRVLFSVFVLVWLTGVVLLSIGTVLSLIQTDRIVLRARQLSAAMGSEDAPQARFCKDTRQALDQLRAILLYSNETTTPFCWQLHSPVIVLPEALRSFPDEELDAVLRHEIAHLKARHPLRLFLQTVIEVLFWCHPLVWRLSWEANIQRELASDLTANSSARQATIFLQAMVRLAEDCRSIPNRLVAGLGFTGKGRSMIQARVDQLLSIEWSGNSHPQCRLRHIACLWLATCIVMLAWIPVNAQVTDRTVLSPWPSLSAAILHECGIPVRDYEQDSHRLRVSHSDEFPHGNR
jgi:bla regulator protein BlaR1